MAATMTSIRRRPAVVAVTEQGAAVGGRPRLYLLDGLRLVAALMVAVHHYVGTFRVNKPNSSPWGQPVEDVFPNLFSVAVYGWIGVEFFFVISGFVICMSCWGKRPRDFLVSRVVRLYPAYWCAILLTTVVITLWPLARDPLPHSGTLLNLTMLQEAFGVRGVDGVYWTLWSELRFYVIFGLLMATGLTYRKVVLFCAAWGFVAALSHTADSELLTLVANPSGAPFFIAGLTLYLMHRFGPDLLLWGMLGMSWLLGQYELIDRVAYESVSSWRGSLVLYTAFLGLMLVIALGRLPRLTRASGRRYGRVMTTAGAMSYPLYLIHYAIGLTLIALLHDDVDPRLLVGGLLVGALVASWLIHRLVERPASRLLKRSLDQAIDRVRTLDGR
ncbi:acyltransferase family protein [Streptomyces sp. 4N509B]|uniref:acyltransferase family protein n=1 Tax=Streptomyces sp. 4N509B TaxID=3457413 RepID=UPI003FD3C402